jgi:hypothetical protein
VDVERGADSSGLLRLSCWAVQQAADPKSDGELVACLAAAAVQHWLQQDKEKHTTAPKNKEGKASLSLAPADGPGADGAGSKKSAPGKYAAVESSAATGAKGSATSDGPVVEEGGVYTQSTSD